MEASAQLLKLCTAWLTPLGLAMLLALLGLALRRRRLVLLAVIWLWVWSTPKAAVWLGGTLEYQHPIQAIGALPPADAIVILGGTLDPPVLPWFPEPNLGPASDRILLGAKLWLAGKAPLVIFSGGSPSSQTPEALVAKDLLMMLGLPSEVIVTESASRTTRENAALLAPVLRAHRAQRVLLVTSAWHMPRSLINLRAAAPDIEWVPAGCDQHTFAELDYPASRWMPNTNALDFSRMMFKEWLGIAWSRVGGQ
jgi:uncharacterized SAM-binding protein YcdF (DUF218 family)